MWHPNASFILLVVFIVRRTENRSDMTKDVIPKRLVECYRQPLPRLLPMTVRSVVDIIRKVEATSFFGTDMRIMSNAILHRFWREGIERDPNVLDDNDGLVVPYRPSGFQSYKYKLLMDYLIPPSQGGDIFPEGVLSISERCSLHFMLSSSVEQWERGDEDTTCPQSNTEQRQTDYFEDSRRKRSSCPVEKGVVQSKEDGVVCMGRVLSAVATALAPVQLPQKYLLDQDLVLPKDELSARMARGGDLIDNKWAATLAGDLAELIVLQAPLTPFLTFGPGGEWNDSIIPKEYYMRAHFTTVAKGFWEATDAELIGSIDGLVLAQEAEKWTELSGTLKLSQLLEMYYSPRGSNLMGHSRACYRRSYYYDHLAKQYKTITQQTQYFAEVMSLTTPHYFTNDTYIILKSQEAFDAFKQYMPSILGTDKTCPNKWTVKPRLKINFILDSTWHSYEKLRFLMSIGDELDVSELDGSMVETIISGTGGVLLVRDATTLGDLYLQWHNATSKGKDPVGLELYHGLLAIKQRIENDTFAHQIPRGNEGVNVFGKSAFGHVTVVVGMSSSITDWDMNRSQQVLKSIKALRPEMQFVYLASPVNSQSFQQLVYSTWDRVIIVDNQNDRENISLVACQELIKYLSYVPRSLRPADCSEVDSRGQPKANYATYEEYITPEIPHYYKIEPMFICRGTEYLVIKFINRGYGSLIACLSRTEMEPIPRQMCKNAGPFDRIDLSLRRPCSRAAPNQDGAQNDDDWTSPADTNDKDTFPCRPVYITVIAKRSLNKCTEKNCRLPDQVRFTVQTIGLSCIGKGGVICSGEEGSRPNFQLSLITISLIAVLTSRTQFLN